jgi:hypothetical protein
MDPVPPLLVRHSRFREVATDVAELEDALCLIDRQKAEEEAVQQLLQRQKAEKRAAAIAVID